MHARTFLLVVDIKYFTSKNLLRQPLIVIPNIYRLNCHSTNQPKPIWISVRPRSDNSAASIQQPTTNTMFFPNTCVTPPHSRFQVYFRIIYKHFAQKYYHLEKQTYIIFFHYLLIPHYV